MSTAIQNAKQCQLTIEAAHAQLQEVVALVKKARSFDEVLRIEDTNAVTAAYLRTRDAATAMGDQIEPLRAKLREIQLEGRLRLAELAQALTAKERVETADRLKIPQTEMARSAIIGSIPRKTIDVAVSIQRRKGLEVEAKELIPLAKLTPPQRKEAIAHLGDVKSIAQAVKAIKPVVVAPAWTPTPNKPAPPAVVVDVKHIEYARAARTLRDVVGRLVLVAERQVAAPTDERKRQLVGIESEIETLLKILRTK